MLYRVTVHVIDSPLFHEVGGVILSWSVDATQPTATVLTSKGVFSTLLIGVPEGLRDPIINGHYQAWYSDGQVMVWLNPLYLI
jgi:hypothetical protein